MKHKKIVNKLLFWFLLIALFPMILFTSLQYSIARKALIKEVKNRLNYVAGSKEKLLDRYISDRRRDAETIAKIPDIIDATKQYKKKLLNNNKSSQQVQQLDQKYRKLLENYLQIFGYSDMLLFSISGEMIFSLNNSDEIGRNYQLLAYKNSDIINIINRAKTLMQVEISNFSYYQDNLEPIAVIAAPIFQENKIIGVIVLEINNQEYNQIVNDYTGLGESGETIVGSLVDKKIVFTTRTRHDSKAALKRYININEKKSHPLNQAIQG
ncbi:MAG: two-component sensor histidine kinase, partial [Sphaerospermopsis sp. SIO1G2]|nr:two-component sensor histidine kinase [Sphaerospermopsis sp. SIO1G2]